MLTFPFGCYTIINETNNCIITDVSLKKLSEWGVETVAIDQQEVKRLEESWKNDPRWNGIKRPYSAEDVLKLRGSVKIEHTLARKGAERL